MRVLPPRRPAALAAGAAVLVAGAAAAAAPSAAGAQATPAPSAAPIPAPLDTAARCAVPDTVEVRGLSRVTAATALGDIGIAARSTVATPQLQGAIRRLFATGEYDDVRAGCELSADARRAALVFQVRERPLLGAVSVVGAKGQDGDAAGGKIDLLVGQPVDPAKVARAVERIDSVYQARGFYLARIKADSSYGADGRLRLVFRVDQGSRLAVSGVRVSGNTRIPDKQVVAAMKTRPEGLLWWRKGKFDEETLAGDLAERLPALYASRGFIDFQVLRDTVVIDRERGKALVELTVREGPQYKVGRFETADNRRFTDEELRRFYPFTGEGPTLTERVTGLVRGRFHAPPKDVFDRARWDAATERVQTAYRNEGYIYARVNPVLERTKAGSDSQPSVNLRWQVEERTPAIVNRIDIAGNDYTTEECIRRQLVLLPGDVFNQDRLLRSWQNIGNLGFFETPLPFPDTRSANEQGDLDVTFRVKEKKTGSFNFGASVGGAGVGVGGFIGVDQPNLFGLCKRGSLNWNFSRIFNDFSMSYSDPAFRKSRVSGSLTAFRRQSRFAIAGIGQNVNTGASVRAGFPVPGSFFSTLGLTYTADVISLGTVQSTVGLGPNVCTRNCFRSSLGTDFTHDTRVDLPFASAGGMQTLTADLSGGLFGGSTTFQRVTGDVRSYVTLGQFGGGAIGSQPKKFVFGLSGRAGALFGSPGAFFLQQGFALGGVQFGQPLRGYPEFSITPRGFNPNNETFSATPDAFGNAYFSSTAELGLRFNQQFYLNTFFDAGNNFARPREFNPTRLFRGAGIGVSVVTPLGPLGLDWAYGFDRRSYIDPTRPSLGTRPDPRWQLHFRLGQMMF
jgi:outer membrane protein insertion porin family